ncbi:MAG: hypothetical protein NC324_02230 [Bacteroides sp.]|nr:hypothetical protein [Bacteroides sp.]
MKLTITNAYLVEDGKVVSYPIRCKRIIKGTCSEDLYKRLEAFREKFLEQELEKERLFGCPKEEAAYTIDFHYKIIES